MKLPWVAEVSNDKLKVTDFYQQKSSFACNLALHSVQHVFKDSRDLITLKKLKLTLNIILKKLNNFTSFQIQLGKAVLEFLPFLCNVLL